jgi:hypothetical protein
MIELSAFSGQQMSRILFGLETSNEKKPLRQLSFDSDC